MNLGISQEQARKKADNLPDGEDDVIKRLQQEVAQLKAKEGGEKKAAGKKCGKCCSNYCKDPDGAECLAMSRQCNVCNKSGHFRYSKLCKGKKNEKVKTKEKSKKIQQAEDSDSDTETSSRIVEERTAQLKGGAKKSNSIVTKVGLQAWDPKGTPQEVKIRVDMDTGVRKTILNRKDWFKICDEAVMVKTKIRFRPYGTSEQLPIRGRAKVQLRAKAGATIVTYVYINDDDTETSLLGKRDAQRLGIVKIKLKFK